MAKRKKSKSTKRATITVNGCDVTVTAHNAKKKAPKRKKAKKSRKSRKGRKSKR